MKVADVLRGIEVKIRIQRYITKLPGNENDFGI